MSHGQRRRRRWVQGWARYVVVGVAGALGLGASAVQADVPRPSVERLPAPYDDWDVTAEPDGQFDGVWRVAFDSPTLGLRETVMVWLPPHWHSRQRLPLVVYLHGTISTRTHPTVEDAGRRLHDAGLPVPYPVGPPTGPAFGPTIGDFAESRDEHRFAIVAPDAGHTPWCPACNWIDGVPADGGVLADTYLQDELLPLMTEVLDARGDRAGVGVIGHSMGGGGAIIQGFRHPDRFAFVGSSSGTLNLRDDVSSSSQGRWAYYNRTQGFEPTVVDEIAIRNVNALDLAANVVGVGTEIVAVIGDACIDPESMDDGDCAGRNPVNDTNGFYQEVYQRYLNNDWTAARLVEAGVPLEYVKREGNHGILASTFTRYFLPRLNQLFAAPAPPPVRVTYRTADPSFDAWGWHVEVVRDAVEFLQLSNARVDGRQVLVSGSGTVSLVTPPEFVPGRAYEVAITLAGGASTVSTATADPNGSLHLTVELGDGAPLDERQALTDAGLSPFGQARVEVRG